MSFLQDLQRFLVAFGLTKELSQPWDALAWLDTLAPVDDVRGQVEPGVIRDGPIVLGTGSVIRAPCRITGPLLVGQNTIIGPFTYVRGPVIVGSDCHIGSTEIKKSIILDETNAAHFNYVGDSILGKNCNLGAGAKLANLRFDNQPIKVRIEDKKFETGLRKLGAILEHNVNVGCNAVLNPGTYIAENGTVKPGEVVSGYRH